MTYTQFVSKEQIMKGIISCDDANVGNASIDKIKPPAYDPM